MTKLWRLLLTPLAGVYRGGLVGVAVNDYVVLVIRFWLRVGDVWAYPGFVDRLLIESGDDRLTPLELHG